METGKKQIKRLFSVLLIILLIGSICGTAEAIDSKPRAGRPYPGQLIATYAGAPSTKYLTLDNTYWLFMTDAAGYSDDRIYWRITPRHPHEPHEMLSGDWGAAIYYDGIGTEPNAMWLTDHFIWPDWTTNSNFQIFQAPSAWDDPCNPIDGDDTGCSVIRNGQVEVRIDYEMVDLGEQEANGVGGSPLTFRDVNGMPIFVYSERYVLLETYTIRNIKVSGNVIGIKFYQMLHGHITDDLFGLSVYSAYETCRLNDPLEDYTPHNSVHKVGNFRYDITQWRNEPNHIDWLGFSSTEEPDVYECGYYKGHDTKKPQIGTHINIEQRNLDSNDFSFGEASGAMGWYLGTLEPNESVSLTLAVMLGAGPVPEGHRYLKLTKIDDVNDGGCVWQGREINYRIDYNYPAGPNLPAINDVNIIDELPEEVDFNSASVGGVYNSISRTVTWQIGTLSPGESGFVTLKVKVKCSEPGVTITNKCEIRNGDELISNIAYETPVCSPTLTKEDNVTGCVGPDANITYSICYAANGYDDKNVVIIDSLPTEVNFDWASNDGVYHMDSHTVTWNIGTLEPSESGCRTLKVKVKESTVPGSTSTITNCCRMTGDCMADGVTACEDTLVCAAKVKVDFDDPFDVNTEPGFTSFLLSDSGKEVNGVIIDLGGNLDDRRRENPQDPEYPIPYGEIYRDFIFGIQPSGVTITLWGLGANRNCYITIYAYDAESEPNRLADWTTNGEYLFTADFNGGVINWPNDITDYRFTGTAQADKFGRIIMESSRNAKSPAGLDFAFVNALLVGTGGEYVPTDYATRPVPFNHTDGVAPTATVTWRIGARSEKRDVYMGTKFSDVNTASRGTPKGVLLSTGQVPNTFDYGLAAGRLKLDTEYFWRIDEVNTTPGPTTFWTGEVWDFITLPYTVVDNFNGYATSAALLNVWNDYTANFSAATVSLETAIARDGNSMKYLYENFYEPYYAESEATMTNLVMDPNWFAMGAKSISIWFRGTAGNDANELMSMKLTDSDTTVHTATVVYDGSPNDIKTAVWKEWVIDLSQFATVNMRKVAKIAIRFGDGVAPVGSGIGTVYFDNLRLYVTRCVLSKRSVDLAKADYAPPGNTAGDCVVDYLELEIMANDWLAEDACLPTTDPCDVGLVAYWSFDEADGNRVFAQSETEDINDPCYLGYFDSSPAESGIRRIQPGYFGTSGAIRCDGILGQRITCRNENPASEANEMSLAVWIKWSGPRVWDAYLEGKSQGLISKRRGWNFSDTGLMWMLECDTTPGPRGSFSMQTFDRAVYSPANLLTNFIGQWAHIAATFDGTTNGDACKLYLNGVQVQQGGFAFGPNYTAGITIAQNNDTTGWPEGPESFWGDMDEVRIYNRVLEPNEIAFLADATPDGWNWSAPQSLAEISTTEPQGQRIVNFKDYAIMANQWLKEDLWP